MTPGLLTRIIVSIAIGAPRLLLAQDARLRKPIELGFDAALTYETTKELKATTLTLPVPRVRIGFFVSQVLSLEPAVALQYIRTKVENPLPGTDGIISGTSYDAAVGALFHFVTDRARTQPFIRPFAGVRGYNSGGVSNSYAAYGAGVGAKIPVANRLSTRFELGFERIAENDHQLYASFGLSFFTH
jgi:hypothetical protein